MPRTEEQVAADNALVAAIEGVARAYLGDDPDGAHMFLGDFVVVASRQDLTPGSDAEGVEVFYPEGGIPTYRALGLLEYASTMLRREQSGG